MLENILLLIGSILQFFDFFLQPIFLLNPLQHF